MNILSSLYSRVFAAIFALSVVPIVAFAQEEDFFAPADETGASVLILVAIFLIIGAILSRVWMGIIDLSFLHEEPIDSIEKRQPYLPSVKMVVGTVVCTAALFILSMKTVGGIAPFDGDSGPTRAAVFFALVAVASIIAQLKWAPAKNYVFAFTVGTVVTFILVGFYHMLFDATLEHDPFFMALGIVCTVLAWRFLFGPWEPPVKATVLGTFILWISIHLFFQEAQDQQIARLLATLVALIPAVIWCLLFLNEHKQRLSLVFLMFFAGMLSTAPILFYDAMVRYQIELQFFLFRIVPENFTRSSNAFVSGNLVGITGMKSTLIVTLISFLLVGLIEEFSKFWVLKKSGERFFSSIDDVLQLSIIVAIGFAFAENVINPSYFLSFVQQYLIRPDSPEWGGFLGNVLGRAILTNMVHILSTGVLGYFYGLSLFADPYMREREEAGRFHPIADFLHWILRLPKKAVFRRKVMIMGMTSAVVLHGFFNFIVTLPDLLPGHPRTLGDIFGSPADSLWHYVALLIIPSLFYVVGGFWLLSILFYKKENMKERGCLVTTDNFINQQKMT